MIDTETITIYSRWVPSEGVIVWAKDEGGSPLDPLEIKTRLFSWHEPSFYGSFLDIQDVGGWDGVLLSPVMALDYFASPSPLTHQQLTWSDETKELMRIAPLLLRAVAEKSYLPDFVRWQKGELGWKFPLPMESSVPVYVQEWGEQIINQQLQDPISHPLMEIDLEHRVHWTEEDWLVDIGWKDDPVPFYVALQLLEPTQERGWILRIVLQDREQRDLISAYPDPFAELPHHWKDHVNRVQRELEKMEKILPWLHQTNSSYPRPLNDQEAWYFLSEGSLQLVKAGFIILLPPWWTQLEKHKPRLVAKIQSPVGQSMLGLNQLMQFDWKISIGEASLSEMQFAEILKQKKQLIQVEGKWIQLDVSMLERLQNLMRRMSKQKGMTLGEVLETHFLQEDSEQPLDLHVEINSSLLSMISQLQEISSLPLSSPPIGLQATLRPYQVEGYSWLLFLRRFGLGGCLADDMGLGKTIQWISYLLYMKENEKSSVPSLLICPTSVLGNWQKELKRFAPALRVYVHYGSKRKKGEDLQLALEGMDVVLTTYTLSHLDSEELQAVEWNAIGLDEAQNIKNAYTKQAMAVRQLKGRHRIAMTGTPIENRLTELWSIFDFINPGYLGTLREFTQRFVNPIEKEQDKRLIEQVQGLIRPFLLRRVKTDPSIQLNLPDKLESKEYLSLTPEQASLYEAVLQDLFAQLEAASPMERRGMILASLTKLKQVCNHPYLLIQDGNEPRMDRSPKMERLLEMVDELRQEGEKCLIFTQYVKMGRMLKQVLEQHFEEQIPFLHGAVPKEKRDEMIQQFQDESQSPSKSATIFILSLKAGGIGLNLTAANHVFHIDRWWNPAVENQATDRAYRIGQTRRVQVHKFITLGTLEEKIDDMMERKKELSEQIVGSGEQWITELSGEELKELLTLQRDWVTEET